MAIDGVLNWKAGGSGLYINYRFSQPTRTHRQHIARWYPEIQFPFADQTLTDTVTHQTDGRLNLCSRSDTCPKIFETNSANEYWAKAGSLLTTDTSGRDLDLDRLKDVRYYLFSSQPHGAGTAAGICRQPQNPIKPDPVLRALLVDLDEWVSKGEAAAGQPGAAALRRDAGSFAAADGRKRPSGAKHLRLLEAWIPTKRLFRAVPGLGHTARADHLVRQTRRGSA